VKNYSFPRLVFFRLRDLNWLADISDEYWIQGEGRCRMWKMVANARACVCGGGKLLGQVKCAHGIATFITFLS